MNPVCSDCRPRSQTWGVRALGENSERSPEGPPPEDPVLREEELATRAGVAAAEALAARLDPPMGLLGILFLLLFVVLGQLLVTEPGWS